MPAKRALLILPALLISHSFATAQPNDRALSLLVRALDRTSLKNIIAIMQIPNFAGDPSAGSPRTNIVQVIIAQDGRQKLTVLEPLQDSGLIVLQDGGAIQIYNPDSRVLTTAPTEAFFDPALRRKLVSANYRLELKENLNIAGMGVSRINAVSKRMPNESAEIFVEPNSLFVMRVLIHRASGKSLLRFDTRSVTFPATLPANVFTISTPQGVTTKPEAIPVPVTTLAEARKRAGFTPVKPSNLPYGFVVHRTYVKTGGDYPMIGFELTDGLATVTVLELAANNLTKSQTEELKSSRNVFVRRGNLFIGVDSYLDSKYSKQLMAAFR